MKDTSCAKIQIDQSLFFDLYHLAVLYQDPFDPVCYSALQGCRKKMDRMLNHFLYTTYKTGVSPEIRSWGRKEYLDRIGCPESFRWSDGSDVRLYGPDRKQFMQKDLRKYLHSFPDATDEEKNELRQWVSSGRSPYKNDSDLCDDTGRPMDFISARRCIREMERDREENPDSFAALWEFSFDPGDLAEES